MVGIPYDAGAVSPAGVLFNASCFCGGDLAYRLPRMAMSASSWSYSKEEGSPLRQLASAWSAEIVMRLPFMRDGSDRP